MKMYQSVKEVETINQSDLSVMRNFFLNSNSELTWLDGTPLTEDERYKAFSNWLIDQFNNK